MRTVVAFALLLFIAACGDDGGESEGQSKSRPLGDQQVEARSYPDSKQGLSQQLGDLLAAVESRDAARVDAMVRALALVDAEQWFATRFGSEQGATLARDYHRAAGRIEQMTVLLSELVAANQKEVRVERFDRADDPAAVGYQGLALAKMVRPVPLFSARLCSAGRQHGFHLWSFVYQDGGFRWAGKMKPLSDQPAPAGADELDPLEQRQRTQGAGSR